MIYLTAICLLVASCTIRQQFSFEEDFSGQYEVDINLSSMAALTDNDSMSFLDDLNQDSVIDALNGEDGISGAFIKEKEAVISIGYNFDNVGSLNRAQESANIGEMIGDGVKVKRTEKPLFVVKGKKLFYNPPELDNSEAEADEMEGMSNMIRYELVMKFKEPVKKLSNDDWTISYDRKTITFSVGLDELKEGQNGAVVVKF